MSLNFYSVLQNWLNLVLMSYYLLKVVACTQLRNGWVGYMTVLLLGIGLGLVFGFLLLKNAGEFVVSSEVHNPSPPFLNC